MKTTTIFSKLKFTTLSIIASVAIFASCEEVEPEADKKPDPDVPEVPDVPVPVDPLAEQLNLTFDAAVTGWHTAWGTGDAIGIINSETPISSYTFSETTLFKTGKFKPTDPAEILFAFYPFTAGLAYTAVTDAVTYDYTLPVAQTLKYGSDGTVDAAALRKVSFMCGATVTKEAPHGDTTVALAMHNVNATVKLQITGLTAGTVVKSVTINSRALSPISSLVTISTENGVATAVPVDIIYESGAKRITTLSVGEITVTLDGAKAAADGTLDVYFSVLPSTVIDEDGLFIGLIGENGSLGVVKYVKIPETALVREAGKSYDVSVPFTVFPAFPANAITIAMVAGTTLEAALATAGSSATTVTALILTGPVTKADMEFTRSFAAITHIDMTDAVMAWKDFPAYIYCTDMDDKDHVWLNEAIPPASLTLQEFYYPRDMDSLTANHFEGCKALTRVILPANLKVTSYEMFENCTALVSADLPSSLVFISDYTFQKTKLSYSVIPVGVTHIDRTQWDTRYSDTVVKFLSSVPPTFDKEIFRSSTNILVPRGSADAYRANLVITSSSDRMGRITEY